MHVSGVYFIPNVRNGSKNSKQGKCLFNGTLSLLRNVLTIATLIIVVMWKPPDYKRHTSKLNLNFVIITDSSI